MYSLNQSFIFNTKLDILRKTKTQFELNDSNLRSYTIMDGAQTFHTSLSSKVRKGLHSHLSLTEGLIRILMVQRSHFNWRPFCYNQLIFNKTIIYLFFNQELYFGHMISSFDAKSYNHKPILLDVIMFTVEGLTKTPANVPIKPLS